MLLIAVSCRGISRLLHHRVIIRSKLIQTVEIRALFAAMLVRVHRTPSLARINFTFEIFRLWSLNSFPKCMFKLYISNFTSRFFLISKLCIQLFSDIYVYKSSNRTNNFSLSLSLQVYISGTDSSRPSNYYYIHESVWNVVPPSGRSIPKIDQPK